MPLASVSLENYRSFVDEAVIELRPLTLLFGYNSAGKSAAVRILPILAASVLPGQNAPLALDSEAARGASFRDLLSKQRSDPTLTFGFEWNGNERFRTQAVIRDLPERQVQILERITISSENVEVEALWDPEDAQTNAESHRYIFSVGGIRTGVFPMAVDGLMFTPPKRQPFTELFTGAARRLVALGESVHWLNSLRASPRRIARFGVRPRRMLPDGSNAADFLAHDTLSDGKLLEGTARWFEQATGHRLSVRRYAAGEEQYTLMIAPTTAVPSVEIPVVDAGEGMGQALPVIVLGCLASLGRLGPSPLLAIEHPELHLHPAAHVHLAAFLCSVTRAHSKPTVVVETHSENFLLRVQLAIAHGEISPSDVVVHWLRELQDGRSVLDTITFDAAARPGGDGWPPGVFSEDTEQAKALLRARKERGLV